MQLLQPSFTHVWWHRSNGERVDAGGDRHAPFGDIVPERPDLRLRVRELGDPHDCAMRSSSPLIRVSTGTIRVISGPRPREGPLNVVGQYTGGSYGPSRTSSSSTFRWVGSGKPGPAPGQRQPLSRWATLRGGRRGARAPCR